MSAWGTPLGGAFFKTDCSRVIRNCPPLQRLPRSQDCRSGQLDDVEN